MAITVLHEPKDITFAGSPQFITYLEDGAAGNEVIDFYCDIYAWHGDKATPSGLVATLTQRIEASSSGIATVEFEVSDYIRSNIDADLPKFTLNPAEIIGQAATWYRLEIRTSISDNQTRPISLATKGKGLYERNMNPGTNIIGTDLVPFGNQAGVLVADTERSYMLPVFIGQGTVNNAIVTQFGIIPFVDFGLQPADVGTLESGKQVAYLSLGADTIPGWAKGVDLKYAVTDSLEHDHQWHTFKLRCHSSRPKSLKYLNMHGAIMDIPINGSDMESIQIKRTKYNNTVINPDVGGYDVTARTRNVFLVDASKKYKIDTGWIFEESQEAIQEMLISEYTWYEVETEFYATDIETVNETFIRRLYQNQVGYQIMLNLSRPVINNVK